jgi:hypothetical protein
MQETGLMRRFAISTATVLLTSGALCIGGFSAATAADAFDPANATYEFAGTSFTLADGKVQIMAPSGLPGAPDTPIPNGYTLAKSASGDLGGGSGGEAVALYRGFGANLQWVVLFGFGEDGGTYKQIAASPVYQQDASVESVSVANGTVTVDLLVVSEADKDKPHYAQTLTQPLTLTFRIADGAFVAVQ